MNNVEDKIFLTEIPNVEEVLSGLKKSKQLEKYRVEFINMLDLIKNARCIQERLLNKWRESRIELSIKQDLIEELQKKQCFKDISMENMKQDLVTAFKGVEESEKKNMLAEDEIVELKTEISNLKSALCEKEQRKWEDVDLDIDTIRKMKELQSTIRNLNFELESSTEKIRKVETALNEALQLVQQHEKELTSLKENLEKELERNVKADRARLNAQKALKEKENRLNSLKGKLSSLKKSCSELESRVESHKLRVFNFQRRNKELHTSFKNAQKSLAIQIQKAHSLNQEKTNCLLQIQKCSEEIEALREKVLIYENSQSISSHKILTLKQQVKDSNVTIELLKTELGNGVKDKNAMLAKHALTEKQTIYLKKEKEVLENNIVKLEALTQKYVVEAKQAEKEKSSLTQELKKSEHLIEVQKLTLHNQENVQQKLLKEINDLKRQIEEMDSKMKSYQNVVNTVKGENEKLQKDFKTICNAKENAFSNLTLCYQWYKGAKDSLESLVNRLHDVNSHANILNQFAEKKVIVISGLMEAVDKLAKKKILLSENVAESRIVMDSLKRKLKDQEMQLKQKLHMSLENEKECEILHTKLKLAIQNCVSLETMLSQKNNKIFELNDEVKKLESEVLKSEHRRMILENDIKLMKQELTNLCRDKILLTEKLSKLQKVEQILNQTQKELVQERVRGSALETEIRHPWNIHRWRLLEGTDPERYQLIMKQIFLQKRLIHKTFEAEKKEQELDKKEKAVEELQSLMIKQSSTDSREKLVDLKWQLREKNDKIKVLTGQVNMYESHVSAYQNEIAELKEKLKNQKSKNLHLQVPDSEKTVNHEYNLSD